MLPPANKPKASAGGLNFDSLNDFDDDDDDGFNPSAYLNNAQKPSAKPQSFGDEDDEDMVDTPKVQMRHSLPPPLRGNSNASSTARVEEDEFSAGEGESGDFDMN